MSAFDLTERSGHLHDTNTVQGQLYQYAMERDSERKVICGWLLYDSSIPDVIGLPDPILGEPVPILCGTMEEIDTAAHRYLEQFKDTDEGALYALEMTFGQFIDQYLCCYPHYATVAALKKLQASAKNSYEAKLNKLTFECKLEKDTTYVLLESLGFGLPDTDMLRKMEELKNRGFKDEKCQCPSCWPRSGSVSGDENH